MLKTFWLSLGLTFWAEMGDKTQFATVALAARFQNVFLVTLGTTLGMMAANAPAVFLGEALTRRIPLKWIRILASLAYALMGLFLLLHR